MTALDASAAGVVDLVERLRPSQRTLPTPCQDWNVRELT
jgi:hypothetical protein